MNYSNNVCYGQTSLYFAIWFFQTAMYSGVVRQTRISEREYKQSECIFS